MKVLSTEGLTKLITLCKNAFLTREDAEDVYTVDVDGDITEADTVGVEEVNPADVFSDWGQSLQGDVEIDNTYICSPYKCYCNERITSFSAPNVTDAVLYYCFANCTSLTSVSLPNLTTIGNSGLYRCFTNCTSLTSVSLPNLTTIGNSGLAYCFPICISLSSISFPALTTTSFGSYANQFNYMLSGVSGCTIHFPSNLESTIQGLDGYPLFGGTNTVLAFDLPATT